VIKIYICVGSSCHLKGSYYIINTLESLIKEYNLKDKVEINASFCLGQCTKGVAMKVDDEPVDNVNVANVRQIFEKYIMGRI
jgi:NADH:ubiquinone oxidoreductase subunit E